MEISILSKFYDIVSIEDNDEHWAIEITDTDSDYFGVQAIMGKVSAEVIDEDQAKLSYVFDVVNNPRGIDVNGIGLYNILGEALEDILYDALDSGEYRLGDKVES
jgi:hypothetical protein